MLRQRPPSSVRAWAMLLLGLPRRLLKQMALGTAGTYRMKLPDGDPGR